VRLILLIKEDIDFKKLQSYISEVLKKDIYISRNIDCCAICGSSDYIKYGLFKGIQRYKCKDCGKTFSNVTNSLLSCSKHSPSKWIEFIELMIEKKSLRFSAAKLDISLVTAFYWRHKILYGLTLDSLSNKLNGDIHIGKTLMIENFKGCRNINTTLRRNIWVIGSKGSEDSMIIKPLSVGSWDLRRFNEKIYSKIEKKSYIIPYGDRYISLIAKSHNKKVVITKNDENRIKFLRSNLNKWLRCFCGISTKYLEEYLSFFILFNLDKKIDCMDLKNYLSLDNYFIKTEKIGLFKN
jgi:transposase-like protein